MSTRPLSDIEIVIRDEINREMLLRAGRALDFLVQELRKLYEKELKVQHGEAGALGGLTGTVRSSKKLIEFVVGTSAAQSYLANLEFGEKGTEGGPADAPFQREKAPPIKNIYEWLRLAAISTPERYIKRAERMAKIAMQKKKPKGFDTKKPWYSIDAQVQFAFAIAMKRKRFGKAGLHIIEREAEQLALKIAKYLQVA